MTFEELAGIAFMLAVIIGITYYGVWTYLESKK